MNVLKLKNNLFRDGNDIISYESVVARIEGSDLIELGKFSITTTKNIHYVAALYNLNLIRADKKNRPAFYLFQLGVKCSVPGELTKETSTRLSVLMRNRDLTYIQALSLLDKVPARDQKLINQYLADNDVPMKYFENLKKCMNNVFIWPG
jgi:hypothetical protein